jgi:hypothetical protein
LVCCWSSFWWCPVTYQKGVLLVEIIRGCGGAAHMDYLLAARLVDAKIYIYTNRLAYKKGPCFVLVVAINTTVDYAV